MKPTNKILDIILTVICNIVTIAPYVWLGADVGRMVKNMEGSNEGNLIGYLFGAFVGIMMWYMVHIIIHEAGHLIAGMMTGWTFVSFRIGNITWMKEDGKWIRKKMTIQGTAGQCLMSPPECKPENCPFTFYLIGGGLLNLLVAAFSLLLYYILPQNIVTHVLFFQCGIAGLVTGLSNLFPAKMSGIVNDGYNIFVDFPRDKKAKIAQYYVLSLHAQLSEKENIEQVSVQLIEGIMKFDYDDIRNISTGNLFNNKAFIHYAKGEYEESEACQRRIVETEGVLELFKNEARCELLLFELLRNDNPDKIKELYNKKLQQYIKATACYPARKCLMYAYYLLYKEDNEKAEKEWAALLKTAETYPAKVETNTAIEMARSIKNRITAEQQAE